VFGRKSIVRDKEKNGHSIGLQDLLFYVYDSNQFFQQEIDMEEIFDKKTYFPIAINGINNERTTLGVALKSVVKASSYIFYDTVEIIPTASAEHDDIRDLDRYFFVPKEKIEKMRPKLVTTKFGSSWVNFTLSADIKDDDIKICMIKLDETGLFAISSESNSIVCISKDVHEYTDKSHPGQIFAVLESLNQNKSF